MKTFHYVIANMCAAAITASIEIQRYRQSDRGGLNIMSSREMIIIRLFIFYRFLCNALSDSCPVMDETEARIGRNPTSFYNSKPSLKGIIYQSIG